MIVDKINSIPLDDEEHQIDMEHIRGLLETIKELEKKIREGKPFFGGVSRALVEELIANAGGGGNFVRGEDLSGQLPSSTLTLAHTPTNGVALYRGNLRQFETEDYTLLADTITLVVPGESGESIICDYEYA